MSLKDLQANGLYVILFLNTFPPEKNNFHWGLYLHQDSELGGIKYHIKNEGGWLTDHGKTGGVFKSFLLVGVFHVATFHANQQKAVDKQIRTYDTSLNDLAGISCRVWLFRVLALLQKNSSNADKIVKCDLKALETEIMDWGNQHAQGASDNVVPRPIGTSSISSSPAPSTRPRLIRLQSSFEQRQLVPAS